MTSFAQLSDADKALLFWIITDEDGGYAFFAEESGLRQFLLCNPEARAISITKMSLRAAIEGGMAPSASTKQVEVFVAMKDGFLEVAQDEGDIGPDAIWCEQIKIHIPIPAIMVIE